MTRNHRDILWQREASCQLSTPTLFFSPPEFEPSVQRRKRETKAKIICGSCSVQEECLGYAIQYEELEGVWGGTNEKERKQKRILDQIKS